MLTALAVLLTACPADDDPAEPPAEPTDEPEEAVGDWHYWVARGYELG
jgi:hypothetical protein